MPADIELGQLVCSQAGRDQGRYYLVVGYLDDRRVKVADGYHRPVTRPKAKNIAHLKCSGHVVLEVKQRLLNGEPLTDEIVRAALDKFCHDLSRKEGD
ncbi:MAG: hypothetical protein GX489_03990 [Firmicutes bacterium]|jgi:large subunit ribosomal protein L14e|nr:hypothetical protein [Bacillota bacterium]